MFSNPKCNNTYIGYFHNKRISIIMTALMCMISLALDGDFYVSQYELIFIIVVLGTIEAPTKILNTASKVISVQFCIVVVSHDDESPAENNPHQIFLRNLWKSYDAAKHYSKRLVICIQYDDTKELRIVIGAERQIIEEKNCSSLPS